KDFRDDQKLTYSSDFHFVNNVIPEEEVIDGLQNLSFKYQFFYEGKVVSLMREAKIFPYPNYYQNQYYILADSLRKYSLLLQLKDNWSGKHRQYKVFAQGLNYNSLTYYISADSLKIKDFNMSDNHANFAYRLKDTISIGGTYFGIEGINPEGPALTLKQMDLKEPFYSWRVGYSMKNFELQGLDGQIFSLDGIAKSGKKFYLIDFWGTWCVPCKELTPDLKRLYAQYFNTLDILSIAIDDNMDVVKEYVSRNNISWKQAYNNRRNRRPLINPLRVSSYPTFIL